VTREAVSRRRDWPGGRAADSATLEREFWRDATVEQKLEALREMAETAWMMEGHVTAPRLQRHLGGVRKVRR
jgi:hypothetical protein